MKKTKKTDEAVLILKALGLPKSQQNVRSALTLLALADMKPECRWKDAKRSIVRIHDILLFAEKRHGKRYAENTRETIRKQTIHQFEQAGIVERNPDDPNRPTNSPLTVYRLTVEMHEALLVFGTKRWKPTVSAFLKKKGVLVDRYAKSRGKGLIPIAISEDNVLQLSPGRHNSLQKQVLQHFKPRFCPSANVAYVGDTAKKMSYVDDNILRLIGIELNQHDKLPDLVLLDSQRNALFLIEVVTAHGPVSAKRQIELEKLFAECRARKIYVTAFPSLREFKRHASEIAWETEVWIAETPDHMIHFNGPKFLALV
jgi:hypothetical protein